LSAGSKAACVKLQNKQNSVRNEENGYPDPDINKTMINVTKEPRGIHIKILKEEILEDITMIFMKISDMVNQNVQDALKKFQDTENEEHEMTQKQKKNSERTSTNIKVKQRTLFL
jgi:hypothetical protein